VQQYKINHSFSVGHDFDIDLAGRKLVCLKWTTCIGANPVRWFMQEADVKYKDVDGELKQATITRK
jgi:hypothetical protein